MTAIFEAIPAILAELDSIGKDRKNQSQGWMFRGVDDVYNALHPLLAKHKVFPTCEFSELTRDTRETSKGGVMYCVTLKAKYTLHAHDGSSVSTEAIGEAMDSGDKACNKAMSCAYKYAMFQLLCIPTEAIDPDNEVHPPSRPATKQPLKVAGRAPDESPHVEPVDPERRLRDDAWVNDCTGEIAAVTSLDELKRIAELIGKQNGYVRDKIRPVYAAKNSVLKSQEPVTA